MVCVRWGLGWGGIGAMGVCVRGGLEAVLGRRCVGWDGVGGGAALGVVGSGGGGGRAWRDLGDSGCGGALGAGGHWGEGCWGQGSGRGVLGALGLGREQGRL